MNKTFFKSILSALFCTLVFFTACTNDGANIMSVSDPVELKFSVSGSRESSRSLSAGDANDIIYIDLSDSDDDTYVLYHTPLQGGENSIDLQQGDSFALGLAHNPSLAEDPASDYISCIGSFLLENADLNSLPFSTDSEDIIDLGSLVFSNSSFESSIDVDAIADSTGYSSTALDSYGAADMIFRNIVNPDINRDGKYDCDEGSFWRFTTMVDMQMTGSEIDFESSDTPVTTPIADFGDFNLRYLLWLKNFDDDLGINGFTNWDDIVFQLKLYNETGDLVETFDVTEAPEDGEWRQFEFGFDEYNEEHKFESGDFTLTKNEGEPSLYFNDIKFITPESNYEGFIFPIVKTVADADGKWQSVSWRWLQIRNGQYKDVADKEAIRLSIQNMYFYFWEGGNSEAYSPEHFGDYNYYENGTIDVSSYDFGMGPADDVNYGKIMTDFWDIGENDYSFGYEIFIE